MNDENMNSQPEVDTSAIASQIAGELFPKAEQNEGGGNLPSPGQEAAPSPTPAAPAPSPLTMPKAWKKEMEPHWMKAAREIQEYALEREADVVRGLTGYKQGHESWNQLISPFQPVLQQHPGVNPVQVLQDLMRGHLMLLQAPPEEKKKLAQQFLKHYGVELNQAEGTPSQPAAVPPEVQNRIDRLERSFYEQKLAEAQEQVNSFFADPKNKYAKELEEDILNILQSNPKLPLARAYEQAMWLNPAVREKLIADQRKTEEEEAKREAEKAAKAQKLNLNGTEHSSRPAPRKGSIEETINSVVDKHYGTH